MLAHMHRLDDALPLLRNVWVAVVCAFALLSVWRAPVGALWKPAVAATEGGYLLVLLLLPAFVGGLQTNRDTLLFACGVAAALLLVSSVWRARSIAASLPNELESAFGAKSTPSRAPAFSMSQLLRLGTEGPAPITHEFEAADGSTLPLDYYAPDGAALDGSAPLVVVIHGGSWSGGDRTQLPAINRWLASRGYAVAAIQYRLAPGHTYPAQVDDVRAATDWLRARHVELGFDPERVVLYGRSAGGHLALLAAYTWRVGWVKAVVGLYPPTDLNWSWEHPSNPLVLNTPVTLSAFIGGAPHDSPEMHDRFADASPYNHVRSDVPPTLLVHGGRDELVKTAHSERLTEQLKEAGVPSFMLSLPWATHGCDANLAGPSGQLFLFSLDWLLRTHVQREPLGDAAHTVVR